MLSLSTKEVLYHIIIIFFLFICGLKVIQERLVVPILPHLSRVIRAWACFIQDLPQRMTGNFHPSLEFCLTYGKSLLGAIRWKSQGHISPGGPVQTPSVNLAFSTPPGTHIGWPRVTFGCQFLGCDRSLRPFDDITARCGRKRSRSGPSCQGLLPLVVSDT